MATDPQYLSDYREGRSTLFWGLSLMVHAMVVIMLLFTPAKNFIMAKPKVEKRAPMRIRGKKLEHFVEELRDQTCEELRDRVSLLGAGQDRMAGNFDTMHKYYFKGFETLQRRTAQDRLEKYMQDTLTRLKRLFDVCKAALNSEKSEDMIRAFQEEMAKILAGMEEIERGVRLIPDLNNLVQPQRDCLERQHTAGQFHRYHEDAISRIEKDIPRLNGQIEKSRAIIAGWQSEISKHREEQDKWAAARDAAKIAAAKAHKNKDAKKKREEEKKRREARNKWKGLHKKVAKCEKGIQRAQDSIKKWQAGINKCEKEKPKAEKRRWSMMIAARNVVSGVYWRQKDVIGKIRAYFQDGTVPPPAEPKDETGEAQDGDKPAVKNGKDP